MLSKLRLRLYQAMRLTWNAAYDLRFGEILRGDIPTRFSELGAERTSNVSYLALSLIFKNEAIAAGSLLLRYLPFAHEATRRANCADAPPGLRSF